MSDKQDQAPAEAHGDEREAFEAWCNAKRLSLWAGRPGPMTEVFCSAFVGYWWEGWQARAASQVQPKGMPTDEQIDALLFDDERGYASEYHSAASVVQLEAFHRVVRSLWTQPAQAPAPAHALAKALEDAAEALSLVGAHVPAERAREALAAHGPQAPAVAPGRPTKPGWYVVLPPDFDAPTVRAFGKDGQWWIPLGKGNGDDGWMSGREYQNWVGPIADIDDRQPFLPEAQPPVQGTEGA